MVPVEKKLSAQQFVICLEHGMLVLTVPAKLTANDRRRIKCLVELVLMDDDTAVNDYLGAEHFADLASKEGDDAD